MLIRGFYKYALDYMKVLNNYNDRFKYRQIYRFYGTVSGNENVMIDYNNRTITLGIRGLPRFLDKNRLKSKDMKRKLEENEALTCSIISEISDCDVVYIGIGNNDMGLILRYLDEEEDREDKKKLRRIDRKDIKKQYGQYIPIILNAKKFGVQCHTIGRNRKSELASFGNAAIKHKSEVFNLLTLYLTHNDLLNNEVGLLEMSKMSPNIYEAVIVQAVYYIMCGIHREILSLSSAKKRNLKVLLVVDEWIKSELLRCISNDLIILLKKNKDPLLKELETIDNLTLKNWTNFLMIFMLLPTILICTIIIYGISKYNYKLKMDRNIIISNQDESRD